MKISAIIVIFGLFIFFCFSCKEKLASPESQSSASFSSQSSKCLKNVLSKSGGLFDSVFVYTFTDSLNIDFSVEANCCPDSNRFSISYNLSHDTIIVSVADTALNGCFCHCPYMIHVNFSNLPNDHYVVQCMIDNYSSVLNPIHLVNVYRRK